MIEIPVAVANSYDVLIARGLLQKMGARIAGVVPPCRAAVITDDTVAKHYLDAARASLESVGFSVCSYAFPAGEASKNLTTLSGILELLAEQQLTRQDLVVALGGGVTGDMAGFAAAVYLRGVRFVQVPTTFLAMIDSSVGGKTAVDLEHGKNLAGVFYQPRLVLIDPDVLSTLPKNVFDEGTAEAVKTGVLFDKTLFSLLADGDFSDRIEEIIASCVRYKAEVVALDERDTGRRQLLNLGHTFGHAVEQASHFAISHGDAVAIGLVMAAKVACATGVCEKSVVTDIRQALSKNALPVECPFTADALLGAAFRDKKRQGQTITLVLPEKIGVCRLEKHDVSELARLFALALEK